MVVPDYLQNIREADSPLTLHTNAGKSETNLKGDLEETTFWLDEGGIANVISLRTLEKKFKVTYESTKDGGAFVCDTKEGKVVFERCPITGFSYVDLGKHGNKTAAMMVQTVRRNYEGYTREEVERAILARKMQARGGHPSEQARTAGELANAMKMVVGLYRRAGIVNITAKNEHVPEIERKIRHVKGRVRCIKADLPYDILPNVVIKRMVLHAGLFINAYVDKQGISDEFSPREIILR
eukprot:CCRYP_014200-RA/>CCRYP_014200-RA protein AED:0.36 eAED:0.36 QI:0/0/0/1/0/0/3/0/238